MPDQPQSCEGCPLYGKARGFVLGAGDPTKAKYTYILEAPGRDEISFSLSPQARAFLPTKEECDRELEIRKRDYPDMDPKQYKFGVPVVGFTGLALTYWIWQKAGIRREEVFIDNTIRCLFHNSKGAPYPTGDDRKAAEKHCRQYDRLHLFRPDTAVVSMHPAALAREITPLPMLVKDAEKVRDFKNQGRRVMALLGGKSTHAFLRYADNVTRWRGHYQALKENWIETYKEFFEFRAKVKKVKTTVVKPEVLTEAPCKSFKRYKGKNPPKCGCSACWKKYEELHVQIP